MKDIVNNEIIIDFDIWNLLKEWGDYGYGCGYNGYWNGDGYVYELINRYGDKRGNGKSRIE
jgi:hypothetical protein